MTTMRSTKPPRYQGKITSWKDDQGFGFITPNGGGPAVFVHIKAFGGRGARPVGNDIVTYELTVNDKGQPRAEHVAVVGGRTPLSPTRPASRLPGSGSLAVAAGFVGLLGMLVAIGKLPLLVLGLYLGLSAVAFIAYAVDKSAARKNARRTPENTLHLLGLAGGWPGALVAQGLLRHKSSKRSFQMAFWLTVAVNCGALGWLLSPAGAAALGRALGSA